MTIPNTMRTTSMLAAAALLNGCGWNYTTSEQRNLPDRPWDPAVVVPADDGLYVPLPYAGALALVRPDGSSELVDIGPGRLGEVSTGPGGGSVAALVDRFTCEPDDPRDARGVDFAEDCATGLTVTREVGLLADGVLGESLPIPSHLNALEWAPDGGAAIAWLNADDDVRLDGVVDLTSVQVLDLTQGAATPVSVGFAANGLLFTEAGDRAIVLSRSEVAVLDLASEPLTLEVVFPLTLDPDDLVDPVGVELTPDGQFALISVRGKDDLYILDLAEHSVNLVSLSGNPTAMFVDSDTDQTVFVYDNSATVDVLEHEYFELQTLQLDEPMNQIIDAGDRVVLYSTGSSLHDAYLLELDTMALHEFRLENPATAMQLSPSNEFAVALTRPENGFGSGVEGIYDGSPGMEILDLRADIDGKIDTDSHPFLLETQGIGLAFAQDDTNLEVLVLQTDQDYLYGLDLYTGTPREIELPEPPAAIGTMPDGTFYITHNVGLGLISFMEPLGTELVAASGFAAAELFTLTPLNEEAP